MTYNTGNPVPSLDPRDLDDNAQAFDRLMNSSNTQEPNRFGVPRLTWSYVEEAAQALVNPNVVGLASLTSGQYKVPMFNNSLGAMVTIDSGALGRTLFALANTTAGQTAGRSALNAVGVGDNITGSAAKLTTARTIGATGDATWSVSFDGSANVTSALTLADTGVTAGTFTRVTVDSKGRVTAGQTSALAIANGGTGATTATTARTALGAAASGANSDITSLTNLTTALSVTQGGTGATAAAGARTNLGLDFSAWTALTPQNSWTLISGRRTSYRKFLDMVQLEVQLTGGTATDGTVIATLPTGFRPAVALVVAVVSPGTQGARVLINTDGTMQCYNCTSATGICFATMLSTST